ncbi:MAG: hypothetical protein GY903_07050 [Fuerstiella sp.]|nr:hypothetical protein [Fuerstiella sp.]MCP4854234.1 hypothetical protein [Fuerstiella sp.]
MFVSLLLPFHGCGSGVVPNPWADAHGYVLLPLRGIEIRSMLRVVAPWADAHGYVLLPLRGRCLIGSLLVIRHCSVGHSLLVPEGPQHIATGISPWLTCRNDH